MVIKSTTSYEVKKLFIIVNKGSLHVIINNKFQVNSLRQRLAETKTRKDGVGSSRDSLSKHCKFSSYTILSHFPKLKVRVDIHT